MKKLRIMIRLALFTFGIFAISHYSFGQQDPQFTSYMFNSLSTNPAYAGSRDVLSVLLLHRDQWVGFEGAPVTQTLSVHSPLPGKKVGLGYTLINDKINTIGQTIMHGDFSYKLRINDEATLSLGLKAGFNLYRDNLGENDLIDQNDELFVDYGSALFLPNFGFGLYYSSERYYVSMSMPKLLRNSLDKDGRVTTSSVSSDKEALHYFVAAGYVLDLHEDIKFKPSLLTKFVWGAPVSFDLNASFLFLDQLWLGTSYRIQDAINFLVQYEFGNGARLGYAYDLTISDIRRVSGGTHEIMLGFDFNFGREKLKSPRYF